jgi:hypothetical protein
LLTVDPELRRSRFAWLRDYSESPAPSNIVTLLDHLEYARELGIDPACAGRIHTTRFARLIDEGAITTVPHIAELEPARKTAILVVQTTSLETRLADATLAMFEKYMGALFSRPHNRDERLYQVSRRDVARAMLLFRRTIAALQHAKEAGLAPSDRRTVARASRGRLAHSGQSRSRTHLQWPRPAMRPVMVYTGGHRVKYFHHLTLQSLICKEASDSTLVSSVRSHFAERQPMGAYGLFITGLRM